VATLADLLRLGRPHFLLGGAAFLALGIALARHAGLAVDPLDAALATFLALAAQWGVHYGNEAHDADADRANRARTPLAGGTGLIPAGRASVREALLLSRTLFGAAVAATAWLALRAPASLAVSVPLLALAWGYSAPPLRLCARGLGELTTGLVVAVLVPALVLVPAGAPGRAFVPLAPLALQAAAFVAVLSLPDAPGDAATGKRTLAVRLPGRALRVLVQATWLACGLATTWAITYGAPVHAALAGGLALAAAVGLPAFVARRWWTVLAVYAAAIPAAQWGLTLAWALA